jgi:hypothetical protein
MAGTQQLPPYLSYSTDIITGPGGTVETSSTLVEIPLTYYGPSVSSHVYTILEIRWYEGGGDGNFDGIYPSGPNVETS